MSPYSNVSKLAASPGQMEQYESGIQVVGAQMAGRCTMCSRLPSPLRQISRGCKVLKIFLIDLHKTVCFFVCVSWYFGPIPISHLVHREISLLIPCVPGDTEEDFREQLIATNICAHPQPGKY